VGYIKDAIKDAILDGVISNEYAPAYRLMLDKAAQADLTPLHHGHLCHTAMPTPVGDLNIAASDKGIVLIGWDKDNVEKKAQQMGLQPVEALTPLLAQAVIQLNEYLAGTRRDFSLPLDIEGTEFQMRAWNELQKIPYGQTISYGEQATRMGSPKGSRAVAQANHNNPVAIVIPCHRVINADGTPGGYASGPDKKQYLLTLESQAISH